MKYRNRFVASQNAHKHLRRKYGQICLKSNGGKEYDKAFVKKAYHSRCFDMQAKTNKLLNESEKKRVYDNVVRTFY